MFSFKCTRCKETHEGMPSFGALAPLSYYEIPEDERGTRCTLRSDDCVIDEKWFFVRGCLEIPVLGEAEPFVWGVWGSLSKANFVEWSNYFGEARRSHTGPYFGWLNAHIGLYPDTRNLKTAVHIRDDGVRPYIELEPTDHPLAIEQREGITVQRVAELYSLMMHPFDA
jgi:hypothetical protein